MPKHIKNTVKGTRRGSKYPEEIKTAALCAMLTSNNIRDVARRLHNAAGRYGVPESTLRRWYNEALKDKNGQKSLYARAREDAIKAITLKAAQGAALTVDLAVRRIEKTREQEPERDKIMRRLLELDPENDKEERARLLNSLNYRPVLGDFAVTNYMRTLASVGEHARAEQEQAGGGAKSYEEYLKAVTGDEF